MPSHRCTTAALAALALTAGGCLERRLSIRSEPAGALVYLADEELGRTPLEVDFTWYGDYEVTLRLEGWQTLKTHRDIDAPFWEYPPLDLACELMPWRITHEECWSFTLAPAETPTDEGLIQRAGELDPTLGR